jgi:hypothetical protein
VHTPDVVPPGSFPSQAGTYAHSRFGLSEPGWKLPGVWKNALSEAE